MKKTFFVFMYESLEFYKNNHYLSDKKTKIVEFYRHRRSVICVGIPADPLNLFQIFVEELRNYRNDIHASLNSGRTVDIFENNHTIF